MLTLSVTLGTAEPVVLLGGQGCHQHPDQGHGPRHDPGKGQGQLGLALLDLVARDCQDVSRLVTSIPLRSYRDL